ncbi:MAG: helix-turn-helix domain-containing protein [Spirochaetota bacterium]|nr:helix-turn-helix domain-containing protein [Spirochaetota bacterium]
MSQNDVKNDTVSFEENPYSPEIKKPEDIVRLFYIHNVPILPVISKRGILFGILRKDDVIAELSDIARSTVKIDEFVQKLAKKMTMDELLPLVVNVKDLIAIDLFGEVQGRMTRLDLFMAAEGHYEKKEKEKGKEEKETQPKDAVIEWLIYMVLEHIPRALYAVNSNGKTIFFNGHFEEMYINTFPESSDVDIAFTEKILMDSAINDIYTSYVYKRQFFYNKELKAYYERVPLKSENKTAGYLFMFERDITKQDLLVPDIISDTDGIDELLSRAERSILVQALTQSAFDVAQASKMLHITVADLKKRIKKYDITVIKKEG